QRWEASSSQRPVVQVKGGGKVTSLSGRTDVNVVDQVGDSDVGGLQEVVRVGASGILAVASRKNIAPISLDVIGDPEARNPRGVGRQVSAGGASATDMLIAHSDIRGEMGIDLPGIVEEEGVRVQVSGGASDRDPVQEQLDCVRKRRKDRLNAVVGVLDRL